MKTVINTQNENQILLHRCQADKIYAYTDDLALYILNCIANPDAGIFWKWTNLNNPLIINDGRNQFSCHTKAIQMVLDQNYPVRQFETIGELLASDVFNILY